MSFVTRDYVEGDALLPKTRFNQRDEFESGGHLDEGPVLGFVFVFGFGFGLGLETRFVIELSPGERSEVGFLPRSTFECAQAL